MAAVLDTRVREQLRGLLETRRRLTLVEVYGAADDLMAKAENAL